MKRNANDNLLRRQIIDNIAGHMGYIYAIVLYDKMGFGFRKIDNTFNKLQSLKEKWRDDGVADVTSESLLKYAAVKKIDAYKCVKDIPTSDKLALADIKGRCVRDAIETAESTILSTLLLIIPILKEKDRLSNAQIEEFMTWVIYGVHCYNTKMPKEKGYVWSDEYIRQAFIEDEGFDMKEGVRVGR